jgi:hypothetical protein
MLFGTKNYSLSHGALQFMQHVLKGIADDTLFTDTTWLWSDAVWPSQLAPLLLYGALHCTGLSM